MFDAFERHHDFNGHMTLMRDNRFFGMEMVPFADADFRSMPASTNRK